MKTLHQNSLTTVLLIILSCAAVGCRSNPINPVLTLEQDYWFDHDRKTYKEIDLENKDILGRRFYDKQNLYLGKQEFTRKSDGQRYGVSYHADLTWEALQINARGQSIWIISHLESTFRLSPYKVDDFGRQVYNGSVGVRIGIEGDTNMGYADRLGHFWLRWLDVYVSKRDQPVFYVDYKQSTREGLATLEDYIGVAFQEPPLFGDEPSKTSGGLRYDLAEDIVAMGFIIEASAEGEVSVYQTEPDDPWDERDQSDYVFTPGEDITVKEVGRGGK